MMTPGKIVVYLLCFGCLVSFAKASGRQKRDLRFPKGASFVTAIALASFLPKGPTDGLAHLLEFDLGFPFPEQFSVGFKKQAMKKTWKKPEVIKSKNWYKTSIKGKKWRAKRDSKENQKENLLLKLEDAINRIGFNGFSCISRFRCELKNISPDSLLEQILLTLFKTVSEPDEQECETHSSNCQISLLQIIMHSEQISSSRLV